MLDNAVTPLPFLLSFRFLFAGSVGGQKSILLWNSLKEEWEEGPEAILTT